MLLNDSSYKTVRIPGTWKNGQFVNDITGEAITEIADNSICEITVHSHRVTDLVLLQTLSVEKEFEILPANSRLFVCVNPEFTPQNLYNFLLPRPQKANLTEKESLVEIKISEPLILKFQGTKPPSLRDCRCEIESLKSADERTWKAESLNHAYRLISTAFEPRRRSFGGNVFLKVFYFSPETNKWFRLRDIRDIEIAKFETDLKRTYKTLKSNSESSLFES